MSKPVLVAQKDGALLPEEEARALWTEFSVHMDEHENDLAGFAKLKGWFEVRPEHRKGQAVLLVATTEAAVKLNAPPPAKGPGTAKGGGGGNKGKR